MDAKDAIKVENLTKKFGKFTAVDAISFSVKPGELFGLLGPNGAGKTTTINMLSTLLNVSSGTAEVAGFDVSKSRGDVRHSIGVVFQDPALDSNLTGRENLEFHGIMYGVPKKVREERIKEVLRLVELEDKQKVLVEKYSGGMKRRLEIARGLIHKPKVLFLDEPTLGLDAQTRRHIWDYIKKLKSEGNVAIILTTHYMEEADYLCDRVAIIDHGKIIAMDTPEKLKHSLGGDVVCLESQEIPKLVNMFKKVKWVKSVKNYDGSACLTMEHGEKRIPELIVAAEKAGIKVTSVNLHEPSLEDVFIHYTGKTIRDQEGEGSDRARFMRMRMR
ncbi:MAG: ATP-binding cassette domain-containing protein [Candidatus Aenigmarchaeota archaeon]|nr:ATP-binding cassette domain-containing protein [Candidatus Aenigmarchaeota archaeon]